MKINNKTKLDAFFGPMYFRGMFGVNLHLTDRLFSPDSHFVFSSIILKNCFRFLHPSHPCFDNAEERLELWKTDRFATMRKIWELLNSNLNVQHLGIYQLTNHYIQ